MKNNKILLLLILISIFSALYIYGTSIPNKIKGDEDNIVSMLKAFGYSEPHMIDVNGFKKTAYFEVKTDRGDSVVEVLLVRDDIYQIVY